MTFYFVHFLKAGWEIINYIWRTTWRPVRTRRLHRFFSFSFSVRLLHELVSFSYASPMYTSSLFCVDEFEVSIDVFYDVSCSPHAPPTYSAFLIVERSFSQRFHILEMLSKSPSRD